MLAPAAREVQSSNCRFRLVSKAGPPRPILALTRTKFSHWNNDCHRRAKILNRLTAFPPTPIGGQLPSCHACGLSRKQEHQAIREYSRLGGIRMYCVAGQYAKSGDLLGNAHSKENVFACELPRQLLLGLRYQIGERLTMMFAFMPRGSEEAKRNGTLLSAVGQLVYEKFRRPRETKNHRIL